MHTGYLLNRSAMAKRMTKFAKTEKKVKNYPIDHEEAFKMKLLECILSLQSDESRGEGTRESKILCP